jgi:hypothetical protein
MIFPGKTGTHAAIEARAGPFRIMLQLPDGIEE